MAKLYRNNIIPITKAEVVKTVEYKDDKPVFGKPKAFPSELAEFSPRMPLEKILLDPFNLNKEWLINTALEFSRADKVDESAIGSGIITAAIAALNKTVCIYEKPDFQIWASDGVIVVGASGERKGRIHMKCMKPIYEAENDLKQLFRKPENSRRYMLKIAKKRLGKFMKLQTTGGNMETNDIDASFLASDIEVSPEEQKLLEQVDMLSIVFDPEFTVNVITTEKLEDKTNKNGGRYLWSGAETDDAIKVQILAKYTKASRSIQFLLSSINPYPELHQSERFGRKINDAVCGIAYLFMQPSGYKDFIQDAELSDKGIGARLGFIFMKRLAGTRHEEKGEHPLDVELVETYWERVRKMAVHVPDKDRTNHRYGQNEDAIMQADIRVDLSPGAAEARRQFHNYMEDQKKPDGLYRNYIADINKAVSQSVIAGTAIQALCTDNFSLRHTHTLKKEFMEQGIEYIKYRNKGALIHKDYEIQQKLNQRAIKLLRAIAKSKKFSLYVDGLNSDTGFFRHLTNSWREDADMNYIIPMLKDLNYIHYEGGLISTTIFVRPDLPDLDIWNV